MISRLATFLLAFYHTIPALTIPYTPISIGRRNVSLTSPTITTIVRSANGTNITSSFRTLVYYQSNTISLNSNLTDRQTASVRRITSCRSARAEFLGSSCSHSRGSDISLLEYKVHCREDQIPNYRLMVVPGLADMPPPEPRYFTEEGSCFDHEICVNSMPHERGDVSIATCVGTEYFLEDPEKSERVYEGSQGQGSSAGQYLGDALRAIGAKKAGIVVSGQDGTTPIELDSLEVDIGAEGGGSKMQQMKCRDCFGLRTHVAALDADLLKIEATLTATVATAGFIWVTFFAG